jgi:hypothetical protein
MQTATARISPSSRPVILILTSRSLVLPLPSRTHIFTIRLLASGYKQRDPHDSGEVRRWTGSWPEGLSELLRRRYTVQSTHLTIIHFRLRYTFHDSRRYSKMLTIRLRTSAAQIWSNIDVSLLRFVAAPAVHGQYQDCDKRQPVGNGPHNAGASPGTN